MKMPPPLVFSSHLQALDHPPRILVGGDVGRIIESAPAWGEFELVPENRFEENREVRFKPIFKMNRGKLGGGREDVCVSSVLRWEHVRSSHILPTIPP